MKELAFGTLGSALLEGKVVPFLGAGVNLSGRPPGFVWTPDASMLPGGYELAFNLADKYQYPDAEHCPFATAKVFSSIAEDSTHGTNVCLRPKPNLDLAKVAQYVSTIAGPGSLTDSLRNIFHVACQPTDVHAYLAEVCHLQPKTDPTNRFPLILTTNYDDLMEVALSRAGLDCDLIYYKSDLSAGSTFWHQEPGKEPVPLRKEAVVGTAYPFCEHRPVVLKIHGTIDRNFEEREDFVITEDDYIQFLAAEPLDNILPKRLLTKMRKIHLLFLGYSLQDWNLRVFLQRLQRAPKEKYKCFSILPSTTSANREFWSNHSVEIIQADFATAISALRDAIRESQERKLARAVGMRSL